MVRINGTYHGVIMQLVTPLRLYQPLYSTFVTIPDRTALTTMDHLERVQK